MWPNRSHDVKRLDDPVWCFWIYINFDVPFSSKWIFPRYFLLAKVDPNPADPSISRSIFPLLCTPKATLLFFTRRQLFNTPHLQSTSIWIQCASTYHNFQHFHKTLIYVSRLLIQIQILYEFILLLSKRWLDRQRLSESLRLIIGGFIKWLKKEESLQSFHWRFNIVWIILIQTETVHWLKNKVSPWKP